MAEILDIFGIDWRLLIIQALNFGVLLFLLWKFLYKPVLGMIDKRQALIEEGVQAAEEAKNAREHIDEERQTVIANATTEGDTLIASAREKAKADEASIVGSAQKRSEQILQDAEMRAQEISERARKENEKEAARLSVLAAEKVLREHVRKA